MGKCQLVPKGRPWLGSNPLPSPAKSKMSHRCVVPKWQVARRRGGGRRCRWIPLRDDARSCQSFDSGKQVLIVNGEWWSWTVQHLRQSLYVISRCRLCRFKFPIGILSFRPALFWSNQLTGRHTQHICYTYIYIYAIRLFNSLPWNIHHVIKNGKPSISMGHLFSMAMLVITRGYNPINIYIYIYILISHWITIKSH